MKKILLIAMLAMFCLSCSAQKDTAKFPNMHDVIEHSSEVFLVTFDKEIGKEFLYQAIEDYGAEIVYDYEIIAGMSIKRPKNKSLEETMDYFRTVKGVLSVEYDLIYKLDDPVSPKPSDR
ncbi:MAG: hypothetical protein IKQ46_09370 [Bacteroidales bacterium]|nr:hypothetical protein [Bacteroidales bacterium]